LYETIGFDANVIRQYFAMVGFWNLNLLKGAVVKRILLTLMIVLIPLGFMSTATDAEAGFGLGLHYLATLGDMKDNEEFDSSNFSLLGAYSLGAGLINFEVDLEWMPNYVGNHDMIQPSAYAFVGGFLYGGVGIGIGYIDSQWQSDPFFALRVGVKLAVLDIFTSYRFQDWSDLEGFDSSDLNSITFGAMFKF
jgi:hypothetical protein